MDLDAFAIRSSFASIGINSRGLSYYTPFEGIIQGECGEQFFSEVKKEADTIFCVKEDNYTKCLAIVEEVSYNSEQGNVSMTHANKRGGSKYRIR